MINAHVERARGTALLIDEVRSVLSLTRVSKYIGEERALKNLREETFSHRGVYEGADRRPSTIRNLVWANKGKGLKGNG